MEERQVEQGQIRVAGRAARGNCRTTSGTQDRTRAATFSRTLTRQPAQSTC